MARKLKIGIDIDDVCVDFISAFRKEAEIVVGRELAGEHGDWSFSNWNITTEERNQIWKKILGTSDWFDLNCKFYPDVEEGLSELQAAGHEVTFITARPATAGYSARDTAILQMGDVTGYPQVIVSYDKGPIVAALGLDIFIDDRLENLISIKDACEKVAQDILLVMRDQSHNRQYKGKFYCDERVSSFTEFVNYIKEQE
jgi:uncharacterized protein